MVTDKNQPKQRKNTKRHCPKFEKQTKARLDVRVPGRWARHRSNQSPRKIRAATSRSRCR